MEFKTKDTAALKIRLRKSASSSLIEIQLIEAILTGSVVGFGQTAETECSFLTIFGVMYYLLPFVATNTGVDYSAEMSTRYK